MTIESKKPSRRPIKLTDAERHKRFVEAAKKAHASDKHEDLDIQFAAIVKGAKIKK